MNICELNEIRYHTRHHNGVKILSPSMQHAEYEIPNYGLWLISSLRTSGAAQSPTVVLSHQRCGGNGTVSISSRFLRSTISPPFHPLPSAAAIEPRHLHTGHQVLRQNYETLRTVILCSL